MLPLLAIADAQASLALADRVEARGRIMESAAGLDAVMMPVASLRARDRRWDATLAYTPAFTLRDVQLAFNPEALHIANARAAWRSRRVELALLSAGTYGQQNFGYLIPPPPIQGPQPPLQLVPGGTTIEFAAWRTALAMSAQPARRWLTATSVGFQMSGGLDTASRAILPFQQGPFAYASVTRVVSRRDSAITTLSGSSTTFSEGPCLQLPGRPPPVPGSTCDPSVHLATLTEGWKYRVSRTIDLTLSFGATVASSRLSSEHAYGDGAYPTFELSSAKRGREVALTILLRLAPVADARTGLVDQRAQANASIVWAKRPWTARVTLGAVQSVPVTDPGAASFLSGDLEVSYRIDERLEVSSATRVGWQTQAPFGTFVAATQVIALTYRQPVIRF